MNISIEGTLEVYENGCIGFLDTKGNMLMFIKGLGKIELPLKDKQIVLELYGPSMTNGTRTVRVTK